jgi:hypothetical protein
VFGSKFLSRGRCYVSKIVSKYNGRIVTQEELDKLMPPKKDWLEKPSMTANTYTEHDPLISEALGVMKSQVRQMRKTLKEEKIQGVSILDNGQARITSRRGRNELMKLYTKLRGNKYHDVDGGYGDH